MSSMTQREVEAAAEEVLEDIRGHDAFSPRHATRANTKEFVDIIIDGLKSDLAAMRDDGPDEDEDDDFEGDEL